MYDPGCVIFGFDGLVILRGLAASYRVVQGLKASFAGSLSTFSPSSANMTPLGLHGLNVVQTVPEASSSHFRDSLASPFPDFSAHLDLWTNLPFDTSEESFGYNKGKRRLSDEHEGNGDHSPSVNSLHDVRQTTASTAPASPLGMHHPNPMTPLSFDNLLAGLGVGQLVGQSTPPGMGLSTGVSGESSTVPGGIPSLAQLFSLQRGPYAVPAPAPPPPAAPGPPPPPGPTAAAQTRGGGAGPAPAPVLTKRARSDSHKGPFPSEDMSEEGDAVSSPQMEARAMPLSAAEEKRRRNTAASARFRLKKKEREAALERRAKELEERVGELERECEGLRRENGWLKGLVVGVTGAGAASQQQQAQN